AYKKDVVKNIEVYGEMHRYIPYLAKEAGFKKIGEKVVHHQARKYGTTKFGINRFFNGYLDLITLWFLTNFGKKPMHVFGLLGSFVFLVGFISLLWLIIEKTINLLNGIYGDLLTNHATFFIALTAMILGTLLFLAGFLGDLISRNSDRRNDYLIEEEINL
ncbi:MAG: glycosyltransferase, partial [Prevotella pallens]|nr:glycosyltransferase [Prevotella pallens]